MLQPAAHDHETMKILVIDDNPDDRAIYRQLLKCDKDADFEIYEAATVRAGLDLCQTQDFDCVIADYHLPDASGVDFIRSYKNEKPNALSAVVMVTGQGSEAVAVEAMKHGALDYIVKDSIPKEFFAQVILNSIDKARLMEKIIRNQDNLERSNKALLDFAQVAAHDLKSPVRRLISYCELLKEDVGEEKLGETGLKYIDRMMVNSARLQKLIDDLLAYSQAMHFKEEKKPVDLGNVIGEIIDSLEPLISESGARIDAGAMPVIAAYPLRMTQLFQNLIANAIKYKGEHSPVISIECSDLGSHYQFCVRDNGMGIDEKYKEKIFNPFERLHAQEKIEGSGLGLAICRKAVHMHKGKIWVESQPGEGSAFHFTLMKQNSCISN